MIALAGCASGRRFEAPAPPRDLGEAATDTVAATRGMIVAPLSIHIPSAMAALNRVIPTRIGNLSETRPVDLGHNRKASLSFEVRRGPFELLGFSGDTVILSAVVRYRGKAWLDSGLGDIGGSCGMDGAAPRARVVLHVVPYLTPDWRLGVRSRVAALTALSDSSQDRCQVTFLGLNVTGKVMDQAKDALDDLEPEIQKWASSVDVKTPLQEIWADLQKPIHLADSLWLLLQPDSVQLGPIHGSTQAVHAELGVRAAPRIVAGPRPEQPVLPLPTFERGQMQRGFSLPVEGRLTYDVIGMELTSNLKGKSLRLSGGKFRLKAATVYGIAGGRIALGVQFDGTDRGTVWFVGTPRYDPGTGMISVPDLDFDASSAGLLVQGFAWIKEDEIRDFLRQQAHISAGYLLKQLETIAIREMNRSLARGVELHATIGAAEPSGLVVGPRDIRVRARAEGSASLEIGPEVFATKEHMATRE